MTNEEARNEIDYLINDGVVTEKFVVPLEQRSIDALKVAKEALQERPKGRWIEQVEFVCDVPNEEYREEIYYDCSECDCSLHWKAPFCPECGHPMEVDGADMRESEQE